MINSPVDEIKSRLDIVEVIQGYIRLQKAGRNYRAVCPFHSEKTPSFMVSPERQIWKCFGCNKGGSIFDFIMEIDGVEFGDALRTLAQRAGVELKSSGQQTDVWRTERKKLYDICELACCFFVRQLEAGKQGGKIREYLLKRGLKPETIKEWRIGYAPSVGWQTGRQALGDFLGGQGYSDEDILKTGLAIKSERPEAKKRYYDRFRDRIIFPIFDINGLVIGFTGRENPFRPDKRLGKYINIPNTLIYDKSRVLYGLNKAKLDIRKKNLCLLAEGQTDVIMSHQAGVRNIVASSGTALTEQQLKIIKRYTENLALAFDMDLAGETAVKRGIDLAMELGLNTKVVSLPQGKDPADCIQNNVNLWSQAVKNQQGLVEFYIAGAFADSDSRTAEGKREITKVLLPVIKKISNKVEQAHWLQEIARRLGVQESVLAEEMEKHNLNKEYRYFNQDCELTEKKRVGNLEEHLLGIILTNLEKCPQIKEEPLYIFANSDLREMFRYLKKGISNEGGSKFSQKSLPADLAVKASEIIFKFETAGSFPDSFDLEKEINFCLCQLKNRYLRQKLSQLNLDIKEAEDKNDKPLIKKLAQEFDKLSKQIIL